MEHRKQITPDNPDAERGEPLPDRTALSRLYPGVKQPVPKELPLTDDEVAEGMWRAVAKRPLRLALGFPVLFAIVDYLVTAAFPLSLEKLGVFSMMPIIVISSLLSGACLLLLIKSTAESLGKLNFGGASYVVLYFFCVLPLWVPLRSLWLGVMPNVAGVLLFAVTYVALGGGIFLLLGLILSRVTWPDTLRALTLVALVGVCMGIGLTFALL